MGIDFEVRGPNGPALARIVQAIAAIPPSNTAYTGNRRYLKSLELSVWGARIGNHALPNNPRFEPIRCDVTAIKALTAELATALKRQREGRAIAKRCADARPIVRGRSLAATGAAGRAVGSALEKIGALRRFYSTLAALPGIPQKTLLALIGDPTRGGAAGLGAFAIVLGGISLFAHSDS